MSCCVPVTSVQPGPAFNLLLQALSRPGESLAGSIVIEMKSIFFRACGPTIF